MNSSNKLNHKNRGRASFFYGNKQTYKHLGNYIITSLELSLTHSNEEHGDTALLRMRRPGPEKKRERETERDQEGSSHSITIISVLTMNKYTRAGLVTV